MVNLAADGLKRDREYLYGIDLIRFSAAFLVVFFHLGFASWAHERSSAAHLFEDAFRLNEGVPILWFGWIGVQIFFVISGYVIANTAEGSSPIRFALSRMMRLYPAVWICGTISLIVLVLFGSYSNYELAVRYFDTIFLLPFHPWVESVYWTLAVEIIFYSGIFFILLLNKFNRIWIFSSILGIYSAIFCFLSLLFELKIINFDVDFGLQFSRVTLARHGCYFSLGVFLWLAARSRMTRRMWVAATIAGIGCVCEIIDQTYYVDSVMIHSPLPLWDRWGVPLLVWGLAVLGIWLSHRYRTRFLGLNNRLLGFMRRLGLMTYPLYLVHFSLGAKVAASSAAWGLSPIAALFIAVGMVVLVSYAVSRYGETVIRDLLKPLAGTLEKRFAGTVLGRDGGCVAPPIGVRNA